MSVYQIPLVGKYGSGHFAFIDEEDYENIIPFRWHGDDRSNGLYAKYHFAKPGHLISMQAYLLKPDDDFTVDHRNHDTLDNRRSNLRVCTHQQNMWHRKPNKRASSKYKGVSKNNKRWQAIIGFDYKYHYLGTFDTEIEAALAYDAAARQLHGEFAYLNFGEI